MARSDVPLLRLRDVGKRFGKLVANEGVDLDVHAGEIVALLGENGAGKTTLMNILFGHYVADTGTVAVAGPDGTLAELSPGVPQAAIAAGVGMVHQHFTLAGPLTGFENIILGTQPLWRAAISRAGPRARLATLIRDTGFKVDLGRRVDQLSVGEKQRVEILKALYRDARILVLDEPTAVLTPQEAEGLFASVRALAARGFAIIFISHKMAEVLSLADRVVVLRAGRKVMDRAAKGLDAGQLAEAMVGSPLKERSRARAVTTGPVLARLDKVSATLGTAGSRDRLVKASLDLRAGEIVGIAGVSGNGQRALAALFSGLAAPSAGRFEIDGTPVGGISPAAMLKRGVGRIPEDRHHDGVVGAMTIAENLALEAIATPRFSRHGFLDHAAMRDGAETAIAGHDIRGATPATPIRRLSGGNMQKAILARVFAGDPRIVLAHQPTRGLDIGAAGAVHRRLLAARAEGAAILLLSEDLDELEALADRIAVLHHGHLTQAFPTETLDRRHLGLLMAGQRDDGATQGAAA